MSKTLTVKQATKSKIHHPHTAENLNSKRIKIFVNGENRCYPCEINPKVMPTWSSILIHVSYNLNANTGSIRKLLALSTLQPVTDFSELSTKEKYIALGETETFKKLLTGYTTVSEERIGKKVNSNQKQFSSSKKGNEMQRKRDQVSTSKSPGRGTVPKNTNDHVIRSRSMSASDKNLNLKRQAKVISEKNVSCKQHSTNQKAKVNQRPATANKPQSCPKHPNKNTSPVGPAKKQQRCANLNTGVSQKATVEPQAQKTFVEPQTQKTHVEPQIQKAHVQPQTQKAPVQPQTPKTHIEPQIQKAHVEPQAQKAHVQPQIQKTHVQPQIHKAHVQPQIHKAHVEPQIQKTYVEPKAHVEPQIQEAHVEPQYQIANIEPQVKKKEPVSAVQSYEKIDDNLKPGLPLTPQELFHDAIDCLIVEKKLTDTLSSPVKYLSTEKIHATCSAIGRIGDRNDRSVDNLYFASLDTSIDTSDLKDPNKNSMSQTQQYSLATVKPTGKIKSKLEKIKLESFKDVAKGKLLPDTAVQVKKEKLVIPHKDILKRIKDLSTIVVACKRDISSINEQLLADCHKYEEQQRLKKKSPPTEGHKIPPRQKRQPVTDTASVDTLI